MQPTIQIIAAPYRHYNKWTIPELLQLQREYELLEWSIPKIARKHERTYLSIIYKLLKEGFVEKKEDIRGFNSIIYEEDTLDYYVDMAESDESDDDYDDYDDYEEEELLLLEEDEETTLIIDVDQYQEQQQRDASTAVETFMNEKKSAYSSVLDYVSSYFFRSQES
jgi:hypothetical protein